MPGLFVFPAPLVPLLAFGFGSWAMLWFLTAAGAPIIIHLWNRRRHREVRWAAMEFLLAAVKKNARRVQIEQLLLLLVRTALLILLALAIAEPYLERVGAAIGGSRRTHRLIVLDASYSMGYKPSDASRFQRAKELASQIVDESKQGDGFTLLLLAAPPRVVVGTPVFDRQDFLDELQNVRLIHGGADLAPTLDRIDEVLQTARREQPKLVREEIYFLSDLGRNTWAPYGDDASGGSPQAAEALRKQADRLAQRSTLVVIDLGQSSGDNMAVADVRTAEPFAIARRPLQIEADIRAFGQGRGQQLVELYVEGRRVAETYVDVPDDGSATAGFTHTFEAPGEQAVEVRIPVDPLEIDNRRFMSVPVKQHLRVLAINGQTSGGRRATDYLTAALAHEADRHSAEIEVDVAPESALAERELPPYDAIFLCNVGQLSRAEALQLRSYVQRGGGLVVCLGDQVQAESYNQRLGASEGLPSLLPARIGNVMTLERPEAQYVFDPLDYAHPITRPFAGNEQVGFLATPVSRYFQLHLLDAPAPDGAIPDASSPNAAGPANKAGESAAPPLIREPPRVALAFTGGDPVIVEQTYGRGRSILMATAAGDDPNKRDPWTLMQVRGNFAVLMHRILASAVEGMSERRNLLVGESLTGHLSLADVDSKIRIRTPWESVDEVLVQADGDGGVWHFDGADERGVYVAQMPAESAGPTAAFAVNVDTRESDLARITPEELREEVWRDVPVVHQTQFQNLEEQPVAAVAQRDDNLPWWLLLGTGGLLFVELGLAWGLGRRIP